jgi:hypothetical protein
MSTIPTSHVNLLAVGVENYKFMRSLRGPQRDVERFVDLMIKSPITGLYNLSQIKTLIDPDSSTLRVNINDYVISRSAQGDVFIFYFSGHGTPIGQSDFGFCTSDARIHLATDVVLPLTVLRFRDLIDSLRVMNITPVIIIDACYSGIVGSAIDISTSTTIGNMQREITRQNASNYALLCSCSDRQVSIGNNNGGIFSQAIYNVLNEGLSTHRPEKSVVYLQDIFPQLINRVNSLATDSTPQLFLGETIPGIPFVKNVGYTPQSYRFQPYLAEIITSLWNEGNEREFSRDEILSNIGRGAYGNHRKLSFIGWSLLEDNPQSGKRRLTEKGRQFAQGKIKIPDEVIYDSIINDYIASPNATLIDIKSIRR